MRKTNTEFSTSYTTELVEGQKILSFTDNNIPVYQERLKVAVDVQLRTKLDQLFPNEHYITQQLYPREGLISCRNSGNYIKYYNNSTIVDFTAVGDIKFVDSSIDTLKHHFQVISSYVKWVHSADGDSITTPLDTSMLPVDSMYPFLGDETLHQYYQRFLESSASIILLIGPPGTGKTTFIRGLLDYSKTSAMVTYDPAILERDSVFVNFIEDSDCSCLILEDSDAFLTARTDGNTMMHRFLNVSNGLVSSRNKKLIFSTNLPSIRDVDPALIRPGRCFDVVKFEPLQLEQAKQVASDMGIELQSDSKTVTIAEIFHQIETKEVSRTFGFNQ